MKDHVTQMDFFSAVFSSYRKPTLWQRVP